MSEAPDANQDAETAKSIVPVALHPRSATRPLCHGRTGEEVKRMAEFGPEAIRGIVPP